MGPCTFETSQKATSGEQHAVVGCVGMSHVDPHLLLTPEHTPTNDLYRYVRSLQNTLRGQVHARRGWLACCSQCHAPLSTLGESALRLPCSAIYSFLFHPSLRPCVPHPSSPLAPPIPFIPPAHPVSAATSLGVVLLQLLSGHIPVPALLPTPAPPSSHPSLPPLLPTHPCSPPLPAAASLGVVLLQLLSGRISDASGKTMPEFFRDSLQANNLAALFDPVLASSSLPPTTNTSASIPTSSTASSLTSSATSSTSAPSSTTSTTTTAGTAAASAADTTLGVANVPNVPDRLGTVVMLIPNALIPSLVRLARVGLACTAMPASSRPSLGRVLAELEIVRDDVATALTHMEEEVEHQEGDLQGGGGGVVAGNRGNELLDSWANLSHTDPASSSPNPSTPPSQLPPSPPPPPVVTPSSSALLPVPLLCQQVGMADVLRATGGWAEDRRIGSGGYGDVYRGVSPLDGCTPWAVKRARVLTNDFRREINEMASKHHPNLVRLLGFCLDYDAAAERMEQIAIYEYMPNGDLYRRMHGNGKGNIPPLTLQQQLDILENSQNCSSGWTF
ncbi:unnamed protein product [Closterium sp. Naga37s-1]|nr:unnamed protein product [Closterium sp. Naga37s-1]